MKEFSPRIERVQFDDAAFDVLRLDLLHPQISGNKWFKLKLNLEKARALQAHNLITFGGPHSNHLLATAAAGKMFGIETLAFVRGGEIDSPTLTVCRQLGMLTEPISRADYRQKESCEFQEKIMRRFPGGWIVPEGGANLEGLLGAAEIWSEEWSYENVVVATGTGTTFGGLVMASKNCRVIGVNVLKGQTQTLQRVLDLLAAAGSPGSLATSLDSANAHVLTDAYVFEGYAGFQWDLVIFKALFEKATGIELDHVYNVKSFYATVDLIKKGYLTGNTLVVHTGGLQGNTAFEARYADRFRGLSVI